MSGGRRKEEPSPPQLANGALRVSAWSKALRSDAAWEDKVPAGRGARGGRRRGPPGGRDAVLLPLPPLLPLLKVPLLCPAPRPAGPGAICRVTRFESVRGHPGPARRANGAGTGSTFPPPPRAAPRQPTSLSLSLLPSPDSRWQLLHHDPFPPRSFPKSEQIRFSLRFVSGVPRERVQAGRGLYFASINLLSPEPGACVHGGLKTILGDLHSKHGTQEPP